MTVKITVAGKTVSVSSPYHAGFVADARAMNGKWNSGAVAWVFDARLESRVRESCLTHYGTDGAQSVPLVTMQLKARDAAGDCPWDNGSQWLLAGRVLLSRPGRDSAVSIGDGVSLDCGSLPKSGGSAKYPMVEASEDTVLRVFDVPRPVAERIVAEHPTAAEIVGQDDPTPSALAAFKDEEILAEARRRGLC